MAAFDDGIKIGRVAYIGLVSVLVTYVLVLFLQVLYFSYMNSLNATQLANEGPPAELTDLRSKQQNALTQRGYVDRQRGVVSVGVTRAKELVVKELAGGKPPREVIGPPRPPGAAAGSAAAGTEGQEASKREGQAETGKKEQLKAEKDESQDKSEAVDSVPDSTPPKKEGSDVQS